MRNPYVNILGFSYPNRKSFNVWKQGMETVKMPVRVMYTCLLVLLKKKLILKQLQLYRY